MAQYGLIETAVIATAGSLVMMWAPQHFLLAMGVTLFAYVVFSLLSSQAFRSAVDCGAVREVRNNEGSRRVFFVALGCPRQWLVKRYIRMYC